MIRRLVALALWTYFAWYLGAMLAAFTGGSPATGPIAAVLMIAAGAIGWIRSTRHGAHPERALKAEPSH
jgi:DMSO reductase anchor subunit